MRGKAGRSLTANPLGGGPLPVLSPFDRTKDLISYQFFGASYGFAAFALLLVLHIGQRIPSQNSHWVEKIFAPSFHPYLYYLRL